MSDVKDPNANPAPAGSGAPGNGVDPKVAELQKQLEETQRKLTEEANARATLETRLTEVEKGQQPKNPQPAAGAPGAGEEQPNTGLASEIEEATNLATIDPKKGAEKLTQLLTREIGAAERRAVTNALKTAEKQAELKKDYDAHVEAVRKANPELAPYEAIIAQTTANKMRGGKDFKTAINESVEEFKKLRKEDIEKTYGAPPAPKGSLGETGSGSNGPKQGAGNGAPAETGDDARDYVALRKAETARKGV